jgi:hypothetical protein
MAVLVRPTNVVLLPALLVLLGFHWRKLALAVAGGLPCLAWLAFYDYSVYGGAFRSGYGNWSDFFAWRYVKPADSYFLQWPALISIEPEIHGGVNR